MNDSQDYANKTTTPLDNYNNKQAYQESSSWRFAYEVVHLSPGINNNRQ